MPIPCAGTAASASCSARITLSAGPIFHCYPPPNVLRMLASLHEWAYGQNEGELRVCLYGSSEDRADGGAERAFHVQQRTQYPWDGEVTLTVLEAPSAPVALALRIPAWAGGATVAVNGVAPRTRPRARSAATRAWRAGDEVRLRLPSAPASLYAEMEAVAPQSVALTLIPYYAWNNRGRGRMSAWLPLYG